MVADSIVWHGERQAEHLIIWGDDIGWFNVSMNNNGIMGYRTPNIDECEGRRNFTDWYGQSVHGGPRRVHHRPVAIRPV